MKLNNCTVISTKMQEYRGLGPKQQRSNKSKETAGPALSIRGDT